MDILVATILIIIGIYVLYISIKKINLTCPKIIEYRYVPRTFEEEQKEPIKVSEVFRRMFENQQPHSTSAGIF